MDDKRLPDQEQAIIRVVVNGDVWEESEGATVSELIQGLGIQHPAIAVERNGQLVPRSDWEAVRLAEGDRLEVVSLVGGG